MSTIKYLWSQLLALFQTPPPLVPLAGGFVEMAGSTLYVLTTFSGALASNGLSFTIVIKQ